MSKNVEQFWDSTAKLYGYKQWEKSEIARFDYNLTKNILLKFLKPTKEETILEVGCGPGRWTKLISERCKRIVATDISKKMIYEAKKYCNNKSIQFIHGDIMKLSIKSKFDKIFAIRVLEYIKDKEGFLNRMDSLLKKNGKIVMITKSKPCLWDVTKKVKNFWQEKIPYKQLTNLLKKKSFHNITVKPVIIRLPIFTRGNREFPIIGKRLEKPALNLFKKISEKAQHTNGNLKKLSLLFSESYLIYAEKNF